jgi:hypothetical protein
MAAGSPIPPLVLLAKVLLFVLIKGNLEIARKQTESHFFFSPLRFATAFCGEILRQTAKGSCFVSDAFVLNNAMTGIQKCNIAARAGPRALRLIVGGVCEPPLREIGIGSTW